jgi:hypothetical protein
MNKPNHGEIMVKLQSSQNPVLLICPGKKKGKGGTDTE